MTRIIITCVLSLLLSSAICQHKQIELLVTAEKTLAKKDTADAILQFHKILQQYPQNYAAITRLAEVYYAQGKSRQSIQYVFLGIDIVEGFLDQSNLKLAKEKRRMTALQYDKNKDINERYKRDLASLYHLLGLNRARKGNYTEAIVNYSDAIKYHKSYPYLIDIALAYFNNKNYELGVQNLQEAKEMQPGDPKSYFNLANIYYQTEQYDSALLYYDKTISLNDSLPYPYLYRAKIYTKEEKLALALENLTAYLDLDTTKVEPYFRRALIYTNQAQFDLALNDWMKVLALDPKNADAIKNRGLTYFFLEEYEEAVEDFNLYLSTNRDPYTLLNRGYSYYLLDNSEKGIIDLNEALPALPRYALGHYIRALINFDLKNRSLACDDLKRALQLGFNENEVDKKLMKRCF